MKFERKTIKYPFYSSILLFDTLILFFASSEALYVIIPAILCTNIFLISAYVIWKRTGNVPFFDIGFFCILATYIYSVYPLINYLLDNLQFGILADSRLRAHDITPKELGYFHYRHVIYLFCMSLGYLFVRKSYLLNTGTVQKPRSYTFWTVLFFFILLTAYFLLLKIAFGLNYNASYETESNAINSQYFANAPLIVLQVSSKLGGILLLFKLTLFFLLISKIETKQWRLILWGWVIFEIVDAILLKGSRSSLMLFLVGGALIYHRIVKPLTFRFLLICGVSFFLFFIFLGLYRAYSDFVSLQSGISESNAGIFSAGNEFQALLGTSFDVLKMRENGTNFPIYLYFNDIITILPPQQILPFEKVAASEWYLRQLGINGTGVGFMWGVVSQSIVGLDWFELVVRGTLLGLLLAWFHNYYLRHQTSFQLTIIYIYMCLRVYYTFRDTTFSFLPFIIWEVLPFLLLLKIGEYVLRLKTRSLCLNKI